MPMSPNAADAFLWTAARHAQSFDAKNLHEVRALLLSLRSQRDKLLEASQAAADLLSRQGWLIGSNDPEAVVLRQLLEALDKAKEE